MVELIFIHKHLHTTFITCDMCDNTAAGGTGQILVQMAKAKGATVIGTCSSEQKAEIARRRGCDFVILTKSGKEKSDISNGGGSMNSLEEDAEDNVWPHLPELVKEIIRTNANEPILPSNYGPININDGAHVVYDSVGKASAMASLACLRPRGTAVLFGNASEAPPDVNPLLLSKLGSLSITRPKLHDSIQTQSEVVSRSDAVFKMLKKHELTLTIQDVLPFTREGVIQGTKMLQGRKTVGKVLFDIRRGLTLHQKHQAAAESIIASRASSLESKLYNINNEFVPQSLEEAYNVQDIVNEAAVSKLIGRKIAATSIMAQKSVSVDEPFYGSLFSHSTFASGSEISIGDASLGLQESLVPIDNKRSSIYCINNGPLHEHNNLFLHFNAVWGHS